MKRIAQALAPLLALAAASPGIARDQHALWRVEGRHNTVYLLGSIHALPPGDGGLPQVANAAYADAEQLVMELDMDDLAETGPAELLAVMQHSAVLPEGQSLRAVLGADYATVERRASDVGLDLAFLDRFAPWFVATTLLQLELAKRGFSPEHGIEQTLAARAAGDGKPIRGLETAEQQVAVLAGLPRPQQKRFLMMTLAEASQIDAELAELVDAWRTGDTESLARLLAREFDEFPDLYRPLTEDRNRAWLPVIEDLLDDGDDYLVVVGALHLVGRNSVIELLERRGYAVRQQ